MAITGQTLKDAGGALFSALTAADLLRVWQAFGQRSYGAEVTDSGTAATAQLERVVYTNNTSGPVRVVSATWKPPVGVTLDPANNATPTVSTRAADGTGKATAASATTNAGGTGTLLAYQKAALTIVPANVVVPVGGSVTVEVVKNGTGVAIGSATLAGRIDVVVEEIG